MDDVYDNEDDNVYESEMVHYTARPESRRNAPLPLAPHSAESTVQLQSPKQKPLPSLPRLEKPTLQRPSSPSTPPKKRNTPMPRNPKRGSKIAKIAGGISLLILSLVMMTLLIVVLTRQSAGQAENIQQDETATPASPTQSAADASVNYSKTSCRDLRANGQTEDGFYSIQPDEEHAEIEVFCDMTTDGGGWTLVASIHENDIKRKCDAADLWSEFMTKNKSKNSGSGNWENDMTFGKVRRSTMSDYKNWAYVALQADDVMVWHVSASYPVTLMKNTAQLRYRTRDKFLQAYGGNLYSLYKDHFPLRVFTDSDKAEVSQQRTIQIIEALDKSTSSIQGQISDWRAFQYDPSYNYKLQSDSMYSSYGNQLYLKSDGNTINEMVYEKMYRLTGTHTYFTTKKSHPFLFVGAIYNEHRSQKYFSLRVNSHRPYYYSYDRRTVLANTVFEGNYKLQYQLICIFRATYPSVYEYHFVVSNTKDWKSIEPTSYTISYTYHASYYRHNEVKLDGAPVNVIMGYMMWSRQSSKLFTTAEANNISRIILQTISGIPPLFKDFTSLNTSLSVPVTFDAGSTEVVRNMVPPRYRSEIEPGFLQMVAYNRFGYPNAFCPGIRTDSINPEYLCIGGKSDSDEAYGTCGDFAGWEGKKGDIVQANVPSGSAHSLKDVFSPVMIFYR